MTNNNDRSYDEAALADKFPGAVPPEMNGESLWRVSLILDFVKYPNLRVLRREFIVHKMMYVRENDGSATILLIGADRRFAAAGVHRVIMAPWNDGDDGLDSEPKWYWPSRFPRTNPVSADEYLKFANSALNEDPSSEISQTVSGRRLPGGTVQITADGDGYVITVPQGTKVQVKYT
jgi:hypothetical protein